MEHTNWEDELQLGEEEDQEIRIVLLGNPGVGKSSSGNTILGRRVFRSAASPSTATLTCERQTGQFPGQQLVVIDTPGPVGPARRGAARCMELAAPGPHVFLLVLEARRFTEADRRMVRLLLGAYGDEALDFTMVLFTHGDQLTAQRVSIQTVISQSTALRGLVQQCGRRRHVFNNMSSDRTQVRDLVTKIRRMMQTNGGDFFTNNMSVMDRGVDEVPDEEEEEEWRQMRQLRPMTEGRLVRPVRPESPESPVIVINNLYVNVEAPSDDNPFRSFPQSPAWPALGAVLGYSAGPVGVGLGSIGGSLAGSLFQDQAQRFPPNNRELCTLQ